MSSELICFHCRRSIALNPGQSIGRSESCVHCSSDLRVCKNCRHYDAGARWECKEEISEPVREKERGNFCDFFQVREAAVTGAGAPALSAAEELRRKAEALFKK